MRGKRSKQYKKLAWTLAQTLEVPELERPIRQRLKRHAKKHGLDAAVRSIALAVAKYRPQRDLALALEHSSSAAQHSGGDDEGVRHPGPGGPEQVDTGGGVLDTDTEREAERDDTRGDPEELV